MALDELCEIVLSLRTAFRSSFFITKPRKQGEIFRIGDDHPQCAGDHVAVLDYSSFTSLYLTFSTRKMDAKLIT